MKKILLNDLEFALDTQTHTASVINCVTSNKTFNIPSFIVVNKVTYQVTSISDNAFSGSYSLTEITIPDSVTSIGERVFCDCFSLKKITIPKTATFIGKYTFYACNSLEEIVIPDSVTSIEEKVFYGCSSLKKL